MKFDQLVKQQQDDVRRLLPKLRGKPGAVIFLREASGKFVPMFITKRELLRRRPDFEPVYGIDAFRALRKAIKDYSVEDQIVVGWFGLRGKEPVYAVKQVDLV